MILSSAASLSRIGAVARAVEDLGIGNSRWVPPAAPAQSCGDSTSIVGWRASVLDLNTPNLGVGHCFELYNFRLLFIVLFLTIYSTILWSGILILTPLVIGSWVLSEKDAINASDWLALSALIYPSPSTGTILESSSLVFGDERIISLAWGYEHIKSRCGCFLYSSWTIRVNKRLRIDGMLVQASWAMPVMPSFPIFSENSFLNTFKLRQPRKRRTMIVT